MAKPFEFGILFGDAPGCSPADLSPGWDLAEIPVALLMRPFDGEAVWAGRRAEIASWGLPPIKASSHFFQDFGLVATGPGADWDQLEFWTRRAFRRLSEVGVEVVGVYGAFFKVPDGFSQTEAIDQGLRFVNLLADEAEERGMVVALEPVGDPESLWPRYRDGVAFARELNRPGVRVMADMDYFARLDQRFEDILDQPDYCMHCHIAGEGAQPGVGNREEELLHFFRVLRDAGYERGVSAACPWVSTEGDTVDFARETAKSLAYLVDLRDRVYRE